MANARRTRRRTGDHTSMGNILLPTIYYINKTTCILGLNFDKIHAHISYKKIGVVLVFKANHMRLGSNLDMKIINIYLVFTKQINSEGKFIISFFEH